MTGLFTNFNNYYIGKDTTNGTDLGRDNLIVCTGEKVNVYNAYAVTGSARTPADVTQPGPTATPPYPRYLFVVTQDYASTSSLWSPIASIVFCSTLLPTLSENSGALTNVAVGNNTGINTSTNAFQPIITDITLPMESAGDYRQFVSYNPSAEYRLVSMGSSSIDVRQIDIQMFWKCRLTNELFPIRMFNQSSVHLKILFRERNGGK
jgi:hypothetical protein